MASIAALSPTYLPQPVRSTSGKDADGDNDGSKTPAASAPATPPVLSNPTDTKGNYVDTHA